MKTYTMSTEDRRKGYCFLIYGEPGTGKTVSLATLPEPILIIVTEPRDPRVTISSVYPDKDITFIEPENFDEYIELLSQLKQECEQNLMEYKSVAIDSLSFAQSKLKIDMEDSRFEKSVSKKLREDLLVDRFRMEMGDWGGISSAMKRIIWLFNQLSKYGIIAVATATLTENPSWNRALVAAPYLIGRELPSIINAYFDFIGLVEKGSPNPYPPTISFDSPDGSFLAKYCDKKLAGKGTLNFSKIISVLEK
jgi:hypothetical protein